MCHFQAQNGPFVMNKIFLVQTIIITFIYLLALFTVQNLKKFLQQIQSYQDVPFLGPKWPICSNFFFLKNINIVLIYLLAPFIVQHSKKNLRSRVKRMCNFWVQNDPFPQIRIFFRKPVKEPCFFHSCLFTHQKSKSHINLLVKY